MIKNWLRGHFPIPTNVIAQETHTIHNEFLGLRSESDTTVASDEASATVDPVDEFRLTVNASEPMDIDSQDASVPDLQSKLANFDLGDSDPIDLVTVQFNFLDPSETLCVVN